MEAKKIKSVFVDGAISATFISDAIAKHSTKKEIGAHSIFLGQVRNDMIDQQEVVAIEYSAYTDMANQVFRQIREDAFSQFDVTCMHIYHSLGRVAAGEICLFVFTSSMHRQQAIEACNYLVERIKKEAPVWGKEIFADENYQWKINQ
ncbi:MAG: molybdenum cofactor biosynthesis protein MoaE [Bacteroidetes bacterium]|nr:molybdenum cofactor biosynthesis protein MoaE [Bacteroidota bacterium]